MLSHEVTTSSQERAVQATCKGRALGSLASQEGKFLGPMAA
jgi:hypothetical protein